MGAVGLLLLVGGAALFLALNRGDAPSVNDADLHVERPVVRPEGNAYPVLQEAAAHLAWNEARAEGLDALANGAEWNDSLARKTVRKNREALDLLGRALRRPKFQAPPTFAKPGHDADMLQTLRWTELGRISAIRAVLRARSGDPERALADAMAPIRLGQLVQSDRGGALFQAMIGVSLKRIGDSALSASLRHFEPTSAKSRSWTAELAGLRTDPDAWRGIWASEYQVTKSIVRDAARRSRGAPDSWMLRIVTPYSFKPKATLNLWADWMRRLQAHSSLSCSEVPRLPVPVNPSWALLTTAWGPNGGGRLVFFIGAPNLVRFEVHRCESDSQLAATEVLVALRAYQVAQGALPDSLDALVPEEIARIPESAMDGKPIRYSRSDRKLCIDDACAKNAVAIPF